MKYWIYINHDIRVVTYRRYEQIRNCEIAETLNNPDKFEVYLKNNGETMYSLFFLGETVKNKLWDEWTNHCEREWELSEGRYWEPFEVEDIEK